MTSFTSDISTVLAALTTIFTPPCSTSWILTTKEPSQFPPFPSAGPTSCDPPAWSSNLAGAAFQFYYSPAICPDGFQVGTSCSLPSSTAQGFPSIAADENVACGFSCTSDTTDFRGGIWGVTVTATATDVIATVGPAMQIRWRDDDLSILATHPLTPGLTLAGSATASPQASAVATTTAVSTTASRTSLSLSTTITSTVTAAASSPGSNNADPSSSAVDALSVASAISPTQNSGAAVSQTITGNSSSSSEGPSSRSTNTSLSKAAIGIAVVASVMGVAGIGALVVFILLRRRRRRRREGSLRDSQSSSDASEISGHRGIMGASGWDRLTPVGLGAWTRQNRSPEANGNSSGSSGSSSENNNNNNWSAVRQRISKITWPNWHAGLLIENGQTATTDPSAQQPQRPQQVHQGQQTQDGQEEQEERPRQLEYVLPELHLPTHHRILSSASSISVTDLEKLHNDVVAASRQTDSQQQRWSWMSRLSRYLRGNDSSRYSQRDSTRDSSRFPPRLILTDSSTDSASRPSTRYSRWTRTDAESLRPSSMTTDGARSPGESSWAAFERSQPAVGVARLVTLVRAHRSAARVVKGSSRGLTVPGNTVLEVPSPTSPSRGEEKEENSEAEVMEDLEDDDDDNDDDILEREDRFSRSSNDTFGYLSSRAAGESYSPV